MEVGESDAGVAEIEMLLVGNLIYVVIVVSWPRNGGYSVLIRQTKPV